MHALLVRERRIDSKYVHSSIKGSVSCPSNFNDSSTKNDLYSA